MGEIPAAAWTHVGALLALAGVALTNRASDRRLRLQLGHDDKVKAREFQRERVEELYVLLDAWLLSLKGYFVSYFEFAKGRMPYDQALALAKDTMAKEKADYTRFAMIIDLYYPQLRPSVDKVFAGPHRVPARPRIPRDHREKRARASWATRGTRGVPCRMRHLRHHHRVLVGVTQGR